MKTQSLRLALLAAATLFSGATLFAEEGPVPFKKGKFDVVVNNVAVVSPEGEKIRTAEDGGPFIETELVKTARKSRTQISLEDGTVIRIGASAVFTFGKDSRSINLERGSVLFHTPPGKGGGSIVTNTATASVTGTTIAVSVTAKGEYECLVLEGTCNVAVGGVVRTVGPGTMVRFAGPNTPGAVVESGSFDVSAFMANSPLTAGFSAPLVSVDAINATIASQKAAGIGSGSTGNGGGSGSSGSGGSGTLSPMSGKSDDSAFNVPSDGPVGGTASGSNSPDASSTTNSSMPTFKADVAAGQTLSPNGEGSATL